MTSVCTGGVGPFDPFGLESVSRRRARETVYPGARGKISRERREKQSRPVFRRTTTSKTARRERIHSLWLSSVRKYSSICAVSTLVGCANNGEPTTT